VNGGSSGPLGSRIGQIHPSLLVALILVLGILLWVNLSSSDEGSPVSAELSLRETLYVTALALNAEYEETGAYPVDLESIGMDEDGLRYTRSSHGYALVAEEEGVRVEYRSGQDLAPLREAFEALLPPF
jgi:hypothetical protein